MVHICVISTGQIYKIITDEEIAGTSETTVAVVAGVRKELNKNSEGLYEVK